MEPPSIVQDFATLFSGWYKSGHCRFAEFKEIWKECQFSMIFAAVIEGYCTDEEWMNVLYSCTYSYLLTNDPRVQLGSVYCLYLLWSTQTFKIKHPVVITFYLLEELKKLLTLPQIPGLCDAITCYNLLVRANAWSFTLVMDILPPPPYWASHGNTKQAAQAKSALANAAALNRLLETIPELDAEYEEDISTIGLVRNAANEKAYSQFLGK